MNAQERRLQHVVAQDRERLAQEEGRMAVQRELRARTLRRDFSWDQLPRVRRSSRIWTAETRAVGFAFLVSIMAGLVAGAAIKGAFDVLQSALHHLHI